MTAIFMTLSTSLVDSGFTGALTRKKDAVKADFDTVFYFNLAVSCLLYAVLFFCSPFIARFFKEPILVPVIRILGISLVINAFGIVQKIILVRRIDFRTQAWISLVSSFAAAVAAVAMAFYGFYSALVCIAMASGPVFFPKEFQGYVLIRRAAFDNLHHQCDLE